MIQEGLEGKIWLTDRGIEQLIQEKLVQGIAPEDIQAMTIDVHAEGNITLGACQRLLVHYTAPFFSLPITTFGDIRSKVRRKGIQAFHAPVSKGFLMMNPNSRGYRIERDTSFAQLYLGGERGTQLEDFDHGSVILEDEKIKKLILTDLLTINPEPTINDGYVWFHTANAITHITNCQQWEWEIQNTIPTKEIEIPNSGVSCRCHSANSIWLKEEVSLSPYIGLQLYYTNIPSNSSQLGGVVDPGFQSGLLAQPLLDDLLNIKPNQIIVRARVLYFPNGVKNPYGSRENRNQFQGTRKTV